MSRTDATLSAAAATAPATGRRPTPRRAWRLAAAVLLAWLTVGCSGQPQRVAGSAEVEIVTPQRPISAYVDPLASYAIDDVYDPWEALNRHLYKFNAKLDRHLLLPLVDGYRAVTPDYVEDRVSDFMANLGDLRTLLNAGLQLKFELTARTLARLAFNSTFGVFGLWDVATPLGLLRGREDFGQTLGHYGVGPGPYLVLPLLGPSSVRDSVGLVADGSAFDAIDPLAFDGHDKRQVAYTLLNVIDTRKQIGFRYYASGSPFEYELVRNLMTWARELEIDK